MKTLLILWALMASSMAWACTSQLVLLPDGRTMVCYYCNGGKIVNCEYL